MAMIDTFSETDDARLTELLGEGFTPFTEAEKTALKSEILASLNKETWTFTLADGLTVKKVVPII
jgi:hypothetical protein